MAHSAPVLAGSDLGYGPILASVPADSGPWFAPISGPIPSVLSLSDLVPIGDFAPASLPARPHFSVPLHYR